MEKVRTAILLDPSWSITQEEEIKAILSDLRRTLGRGRIKLVAVANGFHVLENKAFDLLVIDYGGVAAHGSWGIAEWQLRRVLEWAREHPGGLPCCSRPTPERCTRESWSESSDTRITSCSTIYPLSQRTRSTGRS